MSRYPGHLNVQPVTGKGTAKSELTPGASSVFALLEGGRHTCRGESKST